MLIKMYLKKRGVMSARKKSLKNVDSRIRGRQGGAQRYFFFFVVVYEIYHFFW
jgi:hypothetical protein